MDYIIWTDAAWSKEKGLISSSYVIRTAKTFIDGGSIIDKGNGIAMAETLALGYGATALMKSVDLTSEDTVTFRTDSLSTVKFFLGRNHEDAQSFKVEGSVPFTKDVRVKRAWRTMQELNSICKVDITKVIGHKDTLNENKLADRLAKYSLGTASNIGGELK